MVSRVKLEDRCGRDGAVSKFWWLSLAASILMVILALWLGGQFLFEKAGMLLIFAGIWALMRGIVDIITAFQIKKLGSIVAGS